MAYNLNYKNRVMLQELRQILNASGNAILNYLVEQGGKVLKENLKKIDDEFKEAFHEALKEIKNYG